MRGTLFSKAVGRDKKVHALRAGLHDPESGQLFQFKALCGGESSLEPTTRPVTCERCQRELERNKRLPRGVLEAEASDGVR